MGRRRGHCVVGDRRRSRNKKKIIDFLLSTRPSLRKLLRWRQQSVLMFRATNKTSSMARIIFALLQHNITSQRPTLLAVRSRRKKRSVENTRKRIRTLLNRIERRKTKINLGISIKMSLDFVLASCFRRKTENSLYSLEFALLSFNKDQF
jgi:hypothetical protein